MHLFYTPDIVANFYTLNEEESAHCSRVLRLKEQDVIYLVDGKGGFYKAEIYQVTKKAVQLNILETQKDYGKRNHYLHIAIAPTKNIDRIEWFLEKATEIGIDEITPIICEHSERKVIKEERLNKVITSAMKQSLKAYHPKLNPAISFSQFIKSNSIDNKFIAHCITDEERRTITDLSSKYADSLILIGPEGDFSVQEIQLALQNDFKAITLGNSRLRTETAALAACFEVNYIHRT